MGRNAPMYSNSLPDVPVLLRRLAQQEQNVRGALNRSNLVLGNKSMEPNEIVPLFKFPLVQPKHLRNNRIKWTVLPTSIQCSDESNTNSGA